MAHQMGVLIYVGEKTIASMVLMFPFSKDKSIDSPSTIIWPEKEPDGPSLMDKVLAFFKPFIPTELRKEQHSSYHSLVSPPPQKHQFSNALPSVLGTNQPDGGSLSWLRKSEPLLTKLHFFPFFSSSE